MDISKISSERIQQERVAQDAAQTQKAQQAQAQQKAEASKKAEGAEGSGAKGAADVKWSANAKLADEALAIAKNSPDIRSDKVAALKAAIQSGTYKIDSKGIADRMIESSLQDDLLSRNG
jgi:negative regulator of flagellin synthesis FlgM